MRSPRKGRISIRTAAVGFGVSAIMAAVSVGIVSPASADGVLSQWYPSYYDCQYAGNVYAQQGLIYQFNCSPGASSGWVLTGW